MTPTNLIRTGNYAQNKLGASYLSFWFKSVSLSLMAKTLINKIYKTTIWPVVLYCVEFGLILRKSVD